MHVIAGPSSCAVYALAESFRGSDQAAVTKTAKECENLVAWKIAVRGIGSSPYSPIRRVEEIGHPRRGAIWLKINGELRQEGNLADMVLSPAEIISQLSSLDRLEPGDLISTGTPQKPGPLKRGDQLHGFVEGVGDLHLGIA